MPVFTRTDLDVFTISSTPDRLDAIEQRLGPRLQQLARDLIDELALSTGEELHAQLLTHTRRKKKPPDETWIALGQNVRNLKKEPFFAIALSQNAVHVRVQVREECERKAKLGRVLIKKKKELARHAQQLGALRDFEFWDFEGLPDPAPAAETLFWSTLGNRVEGKKTSRLDIGVGWKGAEALRLTPPRIAEAVAKLMPFYHLLAYDRWRF